MPDLRDTGSLRSFDRCVVYLVRTKLGDGTEADPHRIAETWLTDHGEVIVHIDRWKEAQERAEHSQEGERP